MKSPTTTARNKKTVCVLGPRLLLGRLVAHYLQKMTKTRCHAARTPDEARSLLRRKYERVDLFLWDCEGKDLAPALMGLNHVRGRMPAESLLALFNVGRVSLRGRSAPAVPVQGIFLEDDSIEEIAAGVSSILDGKRWLPTPARRRALAGPKDPATDDGLTPREKRILACIKEGRSNQEIAEAFGLKMQTVKNHIYNIFRKLNVTNRTQAALWATQNLDR